MTSDKLGDIMKDIYVKRLNRILSILFSEIKELDDNERDLPLRWSIMHMYTTSQIAKIIALKRDLDPELAGLIAAMHDIAVIKTKSTKNHAIKAQNYVIELIDLYNNKIRKNLPAITKEEKEIIIEAIIHHSEKNVKTDNKYIELIKDVDSFDRYLHGIKTTDVFMERCRYIYQDLFFND